MTNINNEFLAIMGGLFEVYNQDATQVKVNIYWSTLGQYPIQLVKAAANAWVLKSEFMPKPADLIKLLGGNNKHLSADEAWSLAIMASDESNTVVWTQEMAQAWSLARIVYEDGDHIGARRTFIERYESLVNQSILFNKPVEIFVSIGFDKSKREDAINKAIFSGLLTHEKANHYLPKPENTFAMLEDKQFDKKPSHPLQNLARIKQLLNRDISRKKTH